MAILLIGFSQTAGYARLFAARHAYRIDVNNETVAQGVANVGAGVLQGIPVSTSLSATSLNDSSGARTQMASVVTGGVVVLTLILFAPLFSDLPKPVLAAIIIDAVVFGMMDVGELRRLHRVARTDFYIAIAAIVGVLSSGVLAGVIIGIALSLGWLVHVTHGPGHARARPATGHDHLPAARAAPRGRDRIPGIFVLRFDGGLFFVTTEVLADRLRSHLLDADVPIEHIVLDCEAVTFIDSQGASELHRLVTIAAERGLGVQLARVRPNLRPILVAEGVVALLGADHIHTTVDDAVQAARATTPHA